MVSAKVIKTAEIACWCVGIALVGLYFALRVDGEVERRAAISAFMAEAVPSLPPTDTGKATTRHALSAPLAYAAPDKALWSKGRIRAYKTARAATNQKDGLPVAVLRIRRVGLEVPVYAADTARNMNRGAVLVKGTAPPDTEGNTAIAAHRDGYFRVLENVVVGDVLAVETLSTVQRYRVTSLEVVKPTDVSVLRQTAAPVVTLVTCYPFHFVGPAPNRYIVRAIALDNVDRRKESPAAIPSAHHNRGPGLVDAPRDGGMRRNLTALPMDFHAQRLWLLSWSRMRVPQPASRRSVTR